MPYIGNQPFGKTVRTVTTETITSAKTAYYPNGGYMAGYVDVFVNGVRLSESLDFTATDGSLVTLLYTPNIGDTVEIVTYGSVEIANAVRRSGDTFSGNVYVGSNVYISTSTISVGNATVNTQITAGNIALNGSTLTIGNSTVNTVFTGDTLTLTGTANLSTAINVGANVSMNTTSIRVGNSTINTYIVSDTIYGPSTLYIDPAAAGDNTGLVVVKGDLQVDGTTFTINSANVTVNDKNVVLASGAINNAATDGAGLTIYGTNANLTYNATGNNFEMSRGLSVTGTANVSVALNVGANVNISTSQIDVGNSTVNTVISATALTTTSNTVTLGTTAYVVANGFVGIGTNSPGDKVEVYSTITARASSGTSALRLRNSTSDYQWQTVAGTNAISLYDNAVGTARLTTDSSGNLGIGTTSPGAKLDVSASNAGSVLASRILNTSTSASSDAQQFIYVNSGTAGDPYTTWTVGGVTSWSAGIRNSDSDSWYLSPGSSLGTTPSLTVTTGGFLGIGTSSPAARLSFGGYIPSDGQTVHIYNSGTVRSGLGVVSGVYRVFTDSGSVLSFGQVSTSDGSTYTERARIDSSGNLGLGVTPSTDTLGGKKLEIGFAGNAIQGYQAANLLIYNNATFNSGWKYSSTAGAAYYQQAGNIHYWYNAPSANSGTAISYTTAMTLDGSGNLVIGDTTANGRLAVKRSTDGTIAYFDGTTTQFRIDVSSSTINLNAQNGTGVMAFQTNGSERARIDSSGNLVIGYTSAWARFHVTKSVNNTNASATNISDYQNATFILHNQDDVGTGNKAGMFFAFAGAPGILAGMDGYKASGNWNTGLRWYTNNSTGVNVGNFTERMRLDHDGNLAVGATSGSGKLYVESTTTPHIVARNPSASSYTSLRLYNDQNSNIRALEIDYYGSTASGGERAEIFCTGAYPLLFGTSNTERARIDSSGNLLVGTTSSWSLPAGTGATVYANAGVSVGNSTTKANFTNDRLVFNAGQYYVLNGSSTGVILTSGSTAWAAQSDERTKDIIENITNAIKKVVSLRAVIGKYKVDEEGIRRSFLIAQDVQAVLPEAVSVSDDEQGTLNLRYSEVIPLLTAAIQEQQSIIQSLTARITALESA